MSNIGLSIIEPSTESDYRKLMTADELADILECHRSDEKKIVHCHGVFDLLHIGHIRHFEQANQMGDILVVTITSDQYVDKGPHRPAFTETLRAEAIASLNCVDYVTVNDSSTAEEILRLLRPNVFVKGSEFKNTDSDMTGRIAKEELVVQEIGAKLAFTEDIVFSSTNLINRYLSNLPKEIDQYLELFRQRYHLKDILNLLEGISQLDVFVVGDTIIDEYQYCDVIGKSSKDPALAMKYQSYDRFAGGVLAVANHVANFVNSVKLVTVLGEHDSYEKFIRSQLHPNVEPVFFYQPNAPSIVKRRFVDSHSFNKLFEVYLMDDSGLPHSQNQKVCRYLKKHISKSDLVISSDFGHGAISSEMRKILINDAPFLAVNTQANAGNRGFNTISQYLNADYACIAEHELQLETRSRCNDLRPIMLDVVKKFGYSKFSVTRGRSGCAVCSKDDDFVQIPAFASRVVDRVGAGDSFLSTTALAAYQDTPVEIIGFLGNVVGALAVEIIGNKKAINKLAVQKYLTSLLK